MTVRRYDFADMPATRLSITVVVPPPAQAADPCPAVGASPVVGSGPAEDLLVRLAGELDTDEAERLHSTLSAALVRYRPGRLRLDASELTFIDSGGVRALLQCRDLADRAGIELLTESVHTNAYQVLEITGLVGILGATRAS